MECNTTNSSQINFYPLIFKLKLFNSLTFFKIFFFLIRSISICVSTLCTSMRTKKKKKSNVTLKIEVVNAAMPNKEDVMDVKGIISTGCVCGKV